MDILPFRYSSAVGTRTCTGMGGQGLSYWLGTASRWMRKLLHRALAFMEVRRSLKNRKHA